MVRGTARAVLLLALIAAVSARAASSIPAAGMFFTILRGGMPAAIAAFPLGSRGEVMPSIRVADAMFPRGIAIGPSGRIYVTHATQQGINDVTVYAPDANGNVAPLTTIAGPRTGLDFPSGIALDARGAVYVTNATNNSITIYAPGSSGDAAPVATISGSNTGLEWPAAIALDSSGKIYVANARGGITVYSAGSHGNARPVATITGRKADLFAPHGVALDSSGRIYAVTAGSVNVYAAGSNGDVAPIAAIAGPNTGIDETEAIALDSGGRIYATNAGMRKDGRHSVLVYSAGSSGNVTPVAIIAGSNTELAYPGGIALDSGGKIYVVTGADNGKIVVYSPGGSGNVAPVATITSNNTGLADPYGVAMGPDRKLYVANHVGGPHSACGGRGHGSVTVYPADANGDVAPVATFVGESTGLNLPTSIAVDSAGKVYVANQGGIDTCGRGRDSITEINLARARRGLAAITVYSAAAVASGGGDVPPIATIGGPSTGLGSGTRIALDSSGKIYATHQEFSDKVLIYSPGSNGDVAPVAIIAGNNTRLDNPVAIAVDSRGEIYVANGSSAAHPSITVYPAGSNGNVRPIVYIHGTKTRFAGGVGSIAVDHNGHIYVLAGCPIPDDSGLPSYATCMNVYGANANGNVAPLVTIALPNNRIQGFTGIAIAPPGP